VPACARLAFGPLAGVALCLATGACGGGNSTSAAAPTPQPPAPTLAAAFVMTVPSGLSPIQDISTVTFDGSSSAATGTTIASYSWSFGDGTTGTGATVTKVYASGGTFTVTLTIAGAGLTAATSRPITIGTLTGTWANTFQGQTRTLELHQSASMHSSAVFLLGTYRNSGLAGQSFSVEGSLGPDPARAIGVVARNLDGPTVFDLRGSVSADAGSFSGLVSVGGATGQTLTFTPVR
jgi:PKD repeat protein